MAADSIIGGEEVTDDIADDIMGVINDVLADTQENTIVQDTIGDGALVYGLGANNEIQGVVVPGDGPIVGTLDDGNFSLDIDLPDDVGITFEGLNEIVDGGQATAYLESLVNKALPNPFDPSQLALKNALVKAIDIMLDDTDTDTVVRVINVIDNSPAGEGPEEIKLTGSSSSTNDVVALNLNAVKNGSSVIIENLDKVIVVGPGTVVVGDNTDAVVVGDTRDQVLVGGSGSDTLVGGGGSDTLTGGGGDNVFGINAVGNVTITDFKSTDKIAFSLPGITNFTQLVSSVSSLETTNGNAVATLDNGTVITLIGVDPNTLTADLFLFSV